VIIKKRSKVASEAIAMKKHQLPLQRWTRCTRKT